MQGSFASTQLTAQQKCQIHLFKKNLLAYSYCRQLQAKSLGFKNIEIWLKNGKFSSLSAQLM
jgi:hypothetical protein